LRRFAVDASDDELLATVDEWVELLVQERYDDALANMRAREHWTSDLLRQVISGYGFSEPHPSGSRFRVTSPKEASGRQHYRRVDRWTEANAIGAIGVILYDLPLNGKWSDVTALFDILASSGPLVLELDDIHVL
jgi:hypothetical protein